MESETKMKESKTEMEVRKRDSKTEMEVGKREAKIKKMEVGKREAKINKVEVGKMCSDACKAEAKIKMESKTEAKIKKIKMESKTEMEVGKRESDAKMAKWTKKIAFLVDHRKLEAERDSLESPMRVLIRDLSRSERDSVLLQMVRLVRDSNRLLIKFGKVQEATSVENRPILLSEAGQWLEGYKALKLQMKEENKNKKRINEKRRVRNSGGEKGVVMSFLKKVSIMIDDFVKLSTKVDLAMGNSKEGQAMELDLVMGPSKEGQAMEVDLSVGNSKEGQSMEVDLAMGNSKEGQSKEVDLAMGNSKEGQSKEVDLAMRNSKEGHATEVDLVMRNSKEGHATEVDLAIENSKEGLKGDRSQKRKEAKKARKLQKGLAKREEWMRKMDEEERLRDPEEIADPYAYEAKLFEKRWNRAYPTGYGRFEDNTSIPCKRYTFDPASDGRFMRSTLQVFSVKVTGLTEGLQWPLSVFGMVALRDSLDHNRNVIFKRERDNCQTLTNEGRDLVLTGPVRAVVFGDPVVFEVSLYVRGSTESDDKELSLLAASLIKSFDALNSRLIKKSYTSRLSTLDFELGHIVSSVEATISVKVISGPPDGFHGEFVAFTDVFKREILLHNSGVEELHLAGDEIILSRSVVSVESFGKLMVSVRVSDGSVTLMGTEEFKPLEKGITTKELDIAEWCKLEITVAWSLFSYSKI